MEIELPEKRKDGGLKSKEKHKNKKKHKWVAH